MALTKVPYYATVGLNPIVINDISNQFDGVKTVFTMRVDQTGISTILDSKDLEVVINGQRLAPYVTTLPYPWLTPYDSFKGFRALSTSTNNLIIYDAPDSGDSAFLIARLMSTSTQKRRYPFAATTVALGD